MGFSAVARGMLNTIRVATGTLTDSHDETTLLGRVHSLEDHAHKNQWVYPEDSVGVDVLSGNVGVEGALVEIMAGVARAETYDVHFASIINIDKTSINLIRLYKGDLGSEVLLAPTQTVKDATQSGAAPAVIQTEKLPAGTRISASIESSTNATTVTMHLFGHDY